MRQTVSLSTTLYIVAVSRNHQFYLVTSFTWSNLRRLTFAFVFRWRFYPRLIYVLSRCNVRYNDTFPRDVKQIGFYPKQTLTTVFPTAVSVFTVVLVMSSVSLVSFRLMCIFRLSFDILFPCSMAGNFGTHPQPPFGCFFYGTVFAISFRAGVLAPPFHPSQNGYGFSFTKEPVLIDAVTHPSIDRNGISPPLQLKREERCAADVFHLMQLLVQTCFNRTRSVLGFKMEQG